MKYFIASIITFLIVIQSFGQNSPIDFENGGHGSLWTWTVFENDINPALEIVPNPDMSGVNTSSTVAKFTALELGNPWAGCESQHGADIGSFFLDASNSTISIMVWKSVISDVGIKLVRADAWSLGEIKISNTLVNQWEEITFDFSSNEGNTFDQIVIFPDFDLEGREDDNIIYFDNVSFNLPPSAIGSINQPSLEILPNPTNAFIEFQSKNKIEEIRIYSINGTLLLEKSTLEPGSKLDLSFLARGTYFILANHSGMPFIERIVKN